jgi:hypothetical protein
MPPGQKSSQDSRALLARPTLTALRTFIADRVRRYILMWSGLRLTLTPTNESVSRC